VIIGSAFFIVGVFFSSVFIPKTDKSTVGLQTLRSGCREYVAKTALRQKLWEQKTKCNSGNLTRINSTEMKKHIRLKEEIKGTIRAINNNPSQEKPTVTYLNSIGCRLTA
jgi:hypothetical protein